MSITLSHAARAPTARTARAPWAGLVFLYIVWGAGYPAAEVMIGSIPPLLGMAGRSLVAGAVLMAISGVRRRRVASSPSRRELGWAVIVGLLLIFTNGMIIVGMRHVPVGVAALIAGSLPLWIVVLQGVGMRRAAAADVAGVALGFAGLALIIGPAGTAGGARVASMVLIIAAAALQAGGTLTAQRVALPADAFTTLGIGMLASAVGLAAVGLAAGEGSELASQRPQLGAVLALAFLAGPAALGGYLTFVWLLGRMPATTVSTYSYVNPLVAVILAWALLNEPVSTTTLLGGALILTAVGIMLARTARPAPACQLGQGRVGSRSSRPRSSRGRACREHPAVARTPS